MYGLHLLIAASQANYQRVTFVCNSDEEIGSYNSRPLIQPMAQQADAVIVLEPGRIINAIVSSRRGIGNYTIEVHGISSHAGVEPQKGRNAILELAHQVVALQAINGTIVGTTLNVGTIRGGERTNIVPDYACCQIDVRVRMEPISRACRTLENGIVLPRWQTQE
ncbi:MAG TPA: peptidase dimerization domain-containing protein [Ktedonobacteraceae bacterium]|nr:peptidase dimerization domain-containing protein [Ktedonobacteraceae bacterium]